MCQCSQCARLFPFQHFILSINCSDQPPCHHPWWGVPIFFSFFFLSYPHILFLHFWCENVFCVCVCVAVVCMSTEWCCVLSALDGTLISKAQKNRERNWWFGASIHNLDAEYIYIYLAACLCLCHTPNLLKFATQCRLYINRHTHTQWSIDVKTVHSAETSLL